MKKTLWVILTVSLIWFLGCTAEPLTQNNWENPIEKQGRFGSPLVEVVPFVFKNNLYVLENWRDNMVWPDQPSETAASEYEMWIARLPEGAESWHNREYISVAMAGNTLGKAIVHEDRIFVFGVNQGSGRKHVEMTYSDDLINWTDPINIFDSPGGMIFNVSITKNLEGFVFLWETDGVGVPFTMCFGRVSNLDDNWNSNIIENAYYGYDKYTGGPALFYVGGYYYLLYLESLSKGWETRMTRSKDLINWQDAPDNRPFITFNPHHRNIPFNVPWERESNASDPGLTYYNEQVVIFFTGSNQLTAGDLQLATFDGTIQQLMESFFVDVEPMSR